MNIRRFTMPSLDCAGYPSEVLGAVAQLVRAPDS
jgi:hypothetical protein